MQHVTRTDNNQFVLYKSPFAIGEDGTQHPLVGLSRSKKAEYGIYEKQIGPRPETGPTEIPRLNDQPEIIDGVAVYGWSVEPISASNISLTRLQFALACFASGIISATEAEEFASGGVLPQITVDALNLLPDDMAKTVAKIRFRSADMIARTNEFIPVLRDSLGMDDDQVDELFRTGLQM